MPIERRSGSFMLGLFTILIALITSVSAATVFVVDRISASSREADTKFAAKEMVVEIRDDVRALRSDMAAVRESLARAGLNGSKGR